MIGAFKCCGSGARMLRNTGAGGVSSSVLESSHFGNCTAEDYNQKTLPFRQLNWSQKRFLRQTPSSTSGSGSGNARFVIREIEGKAKMKNNMIPTDEAISLSMQKELRKYSRSLREHQTHLGACIQAEAKTKNIDLTAEISKLITDGSPAVRVKNRKDEALLKEWISIQNELRIVKKDRIEEYKRKFQIAGQQALREMEANLQEASSLDELDQAIEGALCSEAKREYTQKSLHDN